jgi:hypothetical protein
MSNLGKMLMQNTTFQLLGTAIPAVETLAQAGISAINLTANDKKTKEPEKKLQKDSSDALSKSRHYSNTDRIGGAIRQSRRIDLLRTKSCRWERHRKPAASTHL